MLIVLVLSVWLAASALALGALLLRIFGFEFSDPAAGLFGAFWTGFCAQLLLVLTMLAVVPLKNPLSLLILFGPSVLYLFPGWRPGFSWPAPGWIAFAGVFVLLISAAAAKPLTGYDTGFYHYPLTLWYREYGAVHGLALLHLRLGFTSSFFGAAAALDRAPFDSRLMHLPNVVAVEVSSLYAFSSFRSALARAPSLSTLFWPISFSLIIATFERYSVSSSPDLIPALLVLFFFWLLHELICHRGAGRRNVNSARADFLLILVGGAAFSAKSSGLLLLIAGCLISFRLTPGNLPGLLVRGSAALVAAIPTVYVNTLTTGFPLYPILPWALPVPWRISPASFAAVRKEIADFPFFDWRPHHAMSLWDKVQHLFLTDNAYLLSLGLISIILLPYILRRLGYSVYTITVAGVAACTAYQIFTVPVYRFSAGFLVVIPSIAIATSRQWLWRSYVLAFVVSIFTPWWREWNRLDWLRAAVLASVVCGYYLLKKPQRARIAVPLAAVFCAAQFVRLGEYGLVNLKEARSDPSLMLMPPALMKLGPNQYVWHKTGQVAYRMPVFHGYERCWATDLPCAPAPKQANFDTIRGLRLYNNADISGGFVEDDQSRAR